MEREMIMIVDRLGHARLYLGVSATLRTALEFLGTTDFEACDPGRIELDGERLFALVQDYRTKPREEAAWEAHRRYIDVQYVVTGCEVMGWSPSDRLKEHQPYDPQTDCELLRGAGDFFMMPAGMVAVFFPREAHMPGLSHNTPAAVRKVVVKIQA